VTCWDKLHRRDIHRCDIHRRDMLRGNMSRRACHVPLLLEWVVLIVIDSDWCCFDYLTRIRLQCVTACVASDVFHCISRLACHVLQSGTCINETEDRGKDKYFNCYLLWKLTVGIEGGQSESNLLDVCTFRMYRMHSPGHVSVCLKHLCSATPHCWEITQITQRACEMITRPCHSIIMML